MQYEGKMKPRNRRSVVMGYALDGSTGSLKWTLLFFSNLYHRSSVSLRHAMSPIYRLFVCVRGHWQLECAVDAEWLSVML